MVAARVVARAALRRGKRLAVARAAVIGGGGDGGEGDGVSSGVGGGVGGADAAWVVVRVWGVFLLVCRFEGAACLLSAPGRVSGCGCCYRRRRVVVEDRPADAVRPVG